MEKEIWKKIKIEEIWKIEEVKWEEMEESVMDGKEEEIIEGWDKKERKREKLKLKRRYMRMKERFEK